MKTIIAATISAALLTLTATPAVFAATYADQSLAERYAPRVNLHPDEVFFPDSVENYVNAADPNDLYVDVDAPKSHLVPASTLGNNY
ncbi:MAG: hypothetical protein MJK04_27230, partial [Psychrosphaera sp.]|nr:hypothetical protein [Psychrosphaera sp.]